MNRPAYGPGLCLCGCGEPAPIAKWSEATRGRIRGQPLRYRRGHNGRGVKWSGPPAIVRFWTKVDRRGEQECWPWRAALDVNGYGRITENGRGWPAHRFAYERLVGPVPDGLELDHLCRNPGCVNPAHLEPVTHAENVRRGRSPMMVAHLTNTCLRGHALIGANVRWTKDGRSCRACIRDRERIDPRRIAHWKATNARKSAERAALRAARAVS